MRSLGSDASTAYLCWLAFLFFAFAFASSVLLQHHHNSVIDVCHIVRSGLTSAFYAKSLRLTPAARAKLTTGAITNMMSIDAQRIGEAVLFLHNLWASPLQIIVSLVLLLRFIGPAALGGAGVAICVLFAETGLAKLSRAFLTHSLFRLFSISSRALFHSVSCLLLGLDACLSLDSQSDST